MATEARWHTDRQVAGSGPPSLVHTCSQIAVPVDVVRVYGSSKGGLHSWQYFLRGTILTLLVQHVHRKSGAG